MHGILIIIRYVIYNNNKYHPQLFLHECLYKLAEYILKVQCYNRIYLSQGTNVNKTSTSNECFFSLMVFLRQKTQSSVNCL